MCTYSDDSASVRKQHVAAVVVLLLVWCGRRLTLAVQVWCFLLIWFLVHYDEKEVNTMGTPGARHREIGSNPLKRSTQSPGEISSKPRRDQSKPPERSAQTTRKISAGSNNPLDWAHDPGHPATTSRGRTYIVPGINLVSPGTHVILAPI